MSKPSAYLRARVKAERVMEQLSREIPEFNLDKRFMTIKGFDAREDYRTSFVEFIVTRYAEVIQELIESIDGLLKEN